MRNVCQEEMWGVTIRKKKVITMQCNLTEHKSSIRAFIVIVQQYNKIVCPQTTMRHIEDTMYIKDIIKSGCNNKRIRVVAVLIVHDYTNKNKLPQAEADLVEM